jgi:ribosome maturation factor RimP
MENHVSTSMQSTTPVNQLSQWVENRLAQIGFELVALEVVNHREKTLRLYIDKPGGISIDDCVKATHELDQPLEENELVHAIFNGPYELEISSPGIDRPLQKPEDFNRFSGQIGRIQTFRALTSDETHAPEYSSKNPKQKNFFGMIRGFEADTQSILFGASPEDGTRKIKHETLIRIPLELIAKAHLEPDLDLPEDSKKEKKDNKKKNGAK